MPNLVATFPMCRPISPQGRENTIEYGNMRRMRYVENLGIIKNGFIDYRFKFTQLRIIERGTEGAKCIGVLSSRRGIHGRYFLKEARFDESRALDQRSFYLDLRNRGVHVPNVFKAVLSENGEPFVLVSDLSGEGERLVLSHHDQDDIKSPLAKKAIRAIPGRVVNKLRGDLLTFCAKAADLDQEKYYELSSTAYFLVLNPFNPEGAEVIVGDLGFGNSMDTRPDSQQRILRSNIYSASKFFRLVLNHRLLPPAENFLHLDSYISSGRLIILFPKTHIGCV